jgi:glycosyltransferase involved in cell wall biosynthesis
MANTASIYYGGFLKTAGGAFQHAASICRELERMGWTVRLITLDDLPIWCRYIPHLAERVINVINRPIGFLYKGYLTRFFYSHLIRTSSDINIFEDIYIAWNSTTPSITIFHAAWSDNLQAFSVNEKALAKLKKHEVALANAIEHPVATVSKPYLQFLIQEHFAGHHLRKIDVIELGVGQDAFKKIDSTTINRKSIVYLGALEARKNVFFMLRVFKKIYSADPAYRLTLIGNGPEEEVLKKFAADHQLPVIFMGKLPREQALVELTKHAIYLHTSVKESFSYALLEAKLIGLKTCAYAHLEVPKDFIDIPIETFNEDEWRNCVIHHPAQQPSFFNADNYTIKKMTESTLNLISCFAKS